MAMKPVRIEIEHHTIKLIVGVIAISLAILTSLFSKTPLESISASYYEEGWSSTIFIGFLFAIAAFLFAYNGRSVFELIISKIAAVCALGVAMFPCSCGGHEEIIPHVHYISAGIMFLILAAFCFSFLKRARSKGHVQARYRVFIYAASGITILASISMIGLDLALKEAISTKISRLTFICEAVALVAFGIAWLTASRIFPIITSRSERLSISPFK
jgi:hypothetical protein